MGLSVVHGIASDMGGVITVSSRPGVETTFKAYLPKSTLIGDGEESDIRSALKGEARILFVDDEEGILNVQSDILTQIGFSVTPVPNPLKALELFRDEPESFDLILTDMTMPKMTGLELAKEIKSIRLDIPIILCTGYSLDITPETIMMHGIIDLLMKPMTTHVMVNAINRAVNMKRL